MYTWTEWNTTI